jgi:hypothetical protein
MIERGATHIGVATGHVVESFRNDLYAGYKTSEGMPPPLSTMPNSEQESSRRMSDSSGRFQSRQIDFPVLARKHHLSSDAALMLLHAGDTMVSGIIHLGFAVAGIDREAMLIAKKCVAHFVLTAG